VRTASRAIAVNGASLSASSGSVGQAACSVVASGLWPAFYSNRTYCYGHTDGYPFFPVGTSRSCFGAVAPLRFLVVPSLSPGPLGLRGPFGLLSFLFRQSGSAVPGWQVPACRTPGCPGFSSFLGLYFRHLRVAVLYHSYPLGARQINSLLALVKTDRIMVYPEVALPPSTIHAPFGRNPDCRGRLTAGILWRYGRE
jgi:hypothetical protein